MCMTLNSKNIDMRIKLLLLFGVFLLASCSEKSEPVKSHEFKKQLNGYYKIQEVYIDKALYLNFDGIANTDLFEEITCTFISNLPNSICQIYWNDYYKSDYVSIEVTVFYSHYDYVYARLDSPGCYDVVNSLGLGIIVNEENKEMIIMKKVDADDYEQFGIINDQYSGHLDSVRWENNYLYLTWTKKFPTSADDRPEDFTEVTMYMTYKKTESAEIN